MNYTVHQVIIIADDLIGALDTAHEFAVRVHETAIIVDDQHASVTVLRFRRRQL